MSDGLDLVLDGTWYCSGWRNVLPQQSTALHMLVATATDRDLLGSIEELVESIGGGWFEYFADGLDCAVRWTHPLDLEDPVEVAAGDAARAECLTAFSLTGLVLPATVRDLATTMVDLGIFTASENESRWRTVEWPPLPEEVLAVSQEFRDAEARRRWLHLHEESAFLIVQNLTPDEPTSISIERLSRTLDLPETAVRGALELLVHDRALMLAGAGGVAVDPEVCGSKDSIVATLIYDPFDPDLPFAL